MEIRDVVLIALLAAVMAALAVFPPLTLPLLAVPITAQSLGPMLAGGILGARRGGLALVLFLSLVAIGLPLLPGGRGGLGVFFGPTAGFLIGYIVAAFAVGFLTERFWNRLSYPLAFAICLVAGVALLYAIGLPWAAYVAKISIGTALAGSLPFIPGDIIKCAVAAAVIMIVKRSYPIISPKVPRSSVSAR